MSMTSNLLVDFPQQCKSPVERTDFVSSATDSDIATIPKTTSTDLIVDFPRQRKRGVQFAETPQLHTYRHHHVDRHELWYTSSDYALMRLAMREDVLQARAARAFREALDYDASTSTLQSHNAFPCPSYIGIEHLLTPRCMKEKRACTARCIQAVLAEQAKVKCDSATRTGWERIALASLTETRKAVLRARKFGELHHLKSIRE